MTNSNSQGGILGTCTRLRIGFFSLLNAVCFSKMFPSDGTIELTPFNSVSSTDQFVVLHKDGFVCKSWKRNRSG